MHISTDSTALNGETDLEEASALADNLERLSSGYRINRGVDGAGMAASPSLQSQLSGLRHAARSTALDSTIANLEVGSQNLTASDSQLADTDTTLDLVAFTRDQILLQAGTEMLAQADAVPQTILKLLR
jgi:flagellin-like hook-associated protein FlgL